MQASSNLNINDGFKQQLMAFEQQEHKLDAPTINFFDRTKRLGRRSSLNANITSPTSPRLSAASASSTLQPPSLNNKNSNVQARKPPQRGSSVSSLPLPPSVPSSCVSHPFTPPIPVKRKQQIMKKKLSLDSMLQVSLESCLARAHLTPTSSRSHSATLAAATTTTSKEAKTEKKRLSVSKTGELNNNNKSELLDSEIARKRKRGSGEVNGIKRRGSSSDSNSESCEEVEEQRAGHKENKKKRKQGVNSNKKEENEEAVKIAEGKDKEKRKGEETMTEATAKKRKTSAGMELSRGVCV